MKNTHTLTCLPMKLTLPILNQLTVELEITDNPYGLTPDDLFQMAARINKKRSFLFVSKVLGKHIPINPKMGLITGALLANRYIETVKGKETGCREELLFSFLNDSQRFVDDPFIDEQVNPVIIGFAETATALGHAFYHSFKQANFLHTTREELIGIEPVITFEEEHSHATSHRCYVDESILNNDREIILVDDEMTTGKTNINIIRSIHAKFPRKMYTVVSILDWRTEEHLQLYKKLEQELEITIHSVSLLKGNIQISGSPEFEGKLTDETEPVRHTSAVSTINLKDQLSKECTSIYYSSISQEGDVRNTPFSAETGRFGLSTASNRGINQSLKEIGQFLSTLRTGRNVLCLGTGEFMYVPMKLASYMGEGVSYQSTTRSPIYIENHEQYGAKYGLTFPNPEDGGIKQFVYNIPPNKYDQVFVFFERAVSMDKLQPMLHELMKANIPDIKVVFFNGSCMSDE
ncbi:phosphoribosyltransferase family protein [Cytobacillus praedii]|uniref:phosphoribosyltransferase family protein n=1 Tax=Cytobacillus praedii TaxID=1742358 RepID=UPI002E1D8352|nr:phosphoribosyltransferase family protein [Cytobacillus praedii]